VVCTLSYADKKDNLSTGKKVNSAIDNPSAYFTAKSSKSADGQKVDTATSSKKSNTIKSFSLLEILSPKRIK